MSRRYGLRVLPGYEVPQFVGDIIPYPNFTREQVEQARSDMTTLAEFHEVVELDEHGEVVE